MIARHLQRAAADAPVEETAPPENLVTLTEPQIAAIGIETETVCSRQMQAVRVAPGRLQYDNRRHVEIRSPLIATISQINVKPGDRVSSGQVLAVFSSPEVGAARADVLVRESERTLAQQQLEWEQSVRAGVERLVAEVENHAPPREILTKLSSERLGTEGERILSAYTSALLNSQHAEQLESLGPSGAVSGRAVQTAAAERDSSRAVLAAAIQESVFAVRQARDRAAASLADAERRLQISREQVSSLLGYSQEQAPMEPPSGLSFVEVRAPFAGTIEAQSFSVSERVAPRDSLFTLADTSQLWVAADIREAEWPALTLAEGQALSVTAPAVPDRKWEAAVYYVGREVDPQTNSVPLVATISNSDGFLRPGQFVRIAVPLGPARDVLAVPSAAIVEHDGQAFVFCPLKGDRFERVNVTSGVTIGDWTEILTGLKAGNTVVSRGAFALKSELLLTGEE
jgi:cobalt-zinc-cadmium efflux system membrane fusion protein